MVAPLRSMAGPCPAATFRWPDIAHVVGTLNNNMLFHLPPWPLLLLLMPANCPSAVHGPASPVEQEVPELEAGPWRNTGKLHK